MRILWIAAIAALVTAGCSSKSKKEASQTTTPAPAVKAEAEKASKKVAPATPAASAATKVECKVKGDTRILEVRTKDKGCETAYTKGGQESVVGSSQNGTAHCEGIVERIKQNLVNAGFTCQ